MCEEVAINGTDKKWPSHCVEEFDDRCARRFIAIGNCELQPGGSDIGVARTRESKRVVEVGETRHVLPALEPIEEIFPLLRSPAVRPERRRAASAREMLLLLDLGKGGETGWTAFAGKPVP